MAQTAASEGNGSDVQHETTSIEGHVKALTVAGRRLRGLSWNKTHQLWRVRIYYNGKLRFVGRFEDAITAAKAYDKAAVYLYGASAITNFGLEACLEDPTEVGSCIIRAKQEAEQQAASRQASPQQQQQQQQQQQAEQGYPPSQCSQHASPTAGSSSSKVVSPSSTASSRQSVVQLDVPTLLGSGTEPAGCDVAFAASTVAGSLSPSTFGTDACQLMQHIPGLAAVAESSTARSTAAAAAAAAVAAAAAAAAVSSSSNNLNSTFNLHHLHTRQQHQPPICPPARSTSLPGLGPIGSSSSSSGLPTASEASRIAQLLLATTQQQQQQQWQQQELSFLGNQLNFTGYKSPCAELQQSLAVTAACTPAGQLFASRQVNLAAECSFSAAAAAAAVPSAATSAASAAMYHQHQLLLHQQQQHALLAQQQQQQLAQQQLHDLAVQEAMLSNTAAAAAAAVAAFPSSIASPLPPGGGCGALFGGHCFVPSTGSPPTLYASTGSSSGSLSSRWSMPL